MKENNIDIKFEADIEELSKSLEFLISQIGCSAEEAGKAMANLSKALSQINTIDNQFIGADTTEKNEPLKIFDPIELNEDELWIIPIGDNEEWKID